MDSWVSTGSVEVTATLWRGAAPLGRNVRQPYACPMRWFLGVDALAVVVFVAAGRSSHDEENTLTAIATTAAPFLIALVGAWLIARAWQAPLSWPTGLAVWVTTAAGGMLLRRFVFQDSTATSFIVAGTVFLGLFLVGWRALALWIRSG
jgi:hypothetical protein